MMMKKQIIIALCAMAMSASTTMAQKPNDHNFEVAKQLDILNHVYKNLDLLYVDTLNPKETVGTAINAMLRSLGIEWLSTSPMRTCLPLKPD